MKMAKGLGKLDRAGTLRAGCARGRAHSGVAYPAVLAVKSGGARFSVAAGILPAVEPGVPCTVGVYRLGSLFLIVFTFLNGFPQGDGEAARF